MDQYTKTPISFMDALTASGDVAFCWELHPNRIKIFGDAAAMFGPAFRHSEFCGDMLLDLLHPDSRAARDKVLSKPGHGNRQFEFLHQFKNTQNDGALVQERSQIVYGDGGSPTKITGVWRRIYPNDLVPSVDAPLPIDPMTQFLGDTNLREHLAQAIMYARRYDASGGFVTIYAEGLANIRETHGDRTANRVLRVVGQRIEAQLRESDIIGRMEDSTFGIILNHCLPTGFETAIKKIIAAIHATPVETHAGPVRITVSAGGVSFPEAAQTADDAVNRAQSALASVRREPSDGFAIYTLSAEQVTRHQLNKDIGERVQSALRDRRFMFAYQPVVCSRSNKLAWNETLLRLVDSWGEVEPATTFVPAAESLGFAGAMDRRSLALAIADLNDDQDTMLSVNVSYRTASDRAWQRSLFSAVQDNPGIAERLIVEISVVDNVSDSKSPPISSNSSKIATLVRATAAIRSFGCKVALDKFSVGNLPVRKLHAIAVDYVKIDGSFIRHLSEIPDYQSFLQDLLRAANQQGFEIVAECVETQEDAENLAAAGVHYIQGWAVGEPSLNKPWERQAVEGSSPSHVASGGMA